MTASDIQRKLAFRHWSYRRQVIVPNCCFAGFEADLLVLQPSGYLHEVEIKVSASDFKREFSHKSLKHGMLTKGVVKTVFGREAIERKNDPLFTPSRRPDSGTIRGQPHKIRSFWFAMPADLAEKLLPDIPDHAGLISIETGQFSDPVVVKHAPILKFGEKADG